MQDKTSVFLAEGIVIASGIILVAVLVIVLSPMLWTDHMIHDFSKPTPSGCSLEAKGNPGSQGYLPVAHCPIWVQYS